MLRKLVEAALHHRLYVLIITIVMSVYGAYNTRKMAIDVFPKMDRPYVTIMLESHGFAPEEIERLITFPIESSMNGAPGVERVRSNSTSGMAMIVVEFDWGRDLYLCRQIVQERLQLIQGKLPPGIIPILSPASSVTGEVMRLALTSDGSVSPMDLRTIADWDVRPRLLTIQGVAQIFTIGGEAKEYLVSVDPILMARYSVSLETIEEALQGANTNSPGGFIYRSGQELLVRNIGRPGNVTELENLVLKPSTHGSIRLGDVGTVRAGKKIPRGTAGVDDQDGVVINILKQPDVNTLDLTTRLDGEIADIKEHLPKGVTLHDQVYRQARFIETAVHNVIEAVRDGALLVVIIIVVFLMNLRMSLIILTAIPISVMATFLIFSMFGMTVNTMTLGGISVAVGELVDAAIVGAENIYRRLRENNSKPASDQRPFLVLIAKSTQEVFSSIILGTFIALLVVLPLFALPGVVGRIFSPIGLAYLLSIFTSMIVSITVTPVLCAYLLRGRLPEYGKDGLFVRVLKGAMTPLVRLSTRLPLLVLLIGAILGAGAVWRATKMGVDLLPEFNEGAVLVLAITPPGTSLDEMSRFSRTVAKTMREVPEIAVNQTGRRAGRSEGDEHAHSVNTSDIETELRTEEGVKPRPLQEIHAHLREVLAKIPGVFCEVGQPIQHLISHMIGGARSQVIVKVYGPDLNQLQQLGQEIHTVMKAVPGVVDSYVEQQVMVPQIRIIPNDFELSRYGLSMSQVLETLETALQGHVLSQVQEGERYFDLTVRGNESLRDHPETIGDFLLPTPNGALIPLKSVAEISEHHGPNMINHENSRRRIFIMCNVAGRDLGSAVNEITAGIKAEIRMPSGYSWNMGGQYEQLIESGQTLTYLFLFALLLMLILLAADFKSFSLATIVMLNIPQAIIGAVLALILTRTHLNMGALVGFVALSGIAARNGILLINHWVTLMRDEGEAFGPAMLLRGCMERLTPVLMTALTTSLGLIPLVLAKGQPGKEILHPVAIVIFGGLITSTLLDFTITPAATYLFGKKSVLRLARKEDT